MCGVVCFSQRDLAIIAVAGIIFSPLLIVGGILYVLGMPFAAGAMKLAKRRRLRSVRKFIQTCKDAKGNSVLQQLWDAVRVNGGTTTPYAITANPDCTVQARWRLGFALLALGDVRAARRQFKDALDQTGYAKDRLAAHYYLAMTELYLQHWDAALTLLSDAHSNVGPSLQGTELHNILIDGLAEVGMFPAHVTGLYAYAKLMAATHASDRVDYAALEEALALAEQAFADDPSNARHAYVAAWCLFYLGLRADEAGKTVTVDETQLKRALTLAGLANEVATRAEREAQANIVSQYGERPPAPPIVEGTVVPKVLEEERVQNVDEDSDGDDKVAPLEAVVTGEGAAGVSVADILSLQAQVHFALGQHGEASVALVAARNINPNVPHSGLSADSDCDPRVGLLAPWLQAKGPGDESYATVRDHEFAEATLVKPTWCDHCMNRVKGFHGLRCKACRYTIHDEATCKQRALERGCWGAQGESSPTVAPTTAPSHQHVLRVRRVHSPHDCIHCGTFIMMMTRALECIVCRSFVHAKCAATLPNSVVDEPTYLWQGKYDSWQ